MCSENDFKEVCTVSILAKRLRLSRSRFYQLQKMGIFPYPVYCIRTRRPLYPEALQQACLAIRKTGIGHNGKPVAFNRRKKGKTKHNSESELKPIAKTLKKMGLNVTHAQVKEAILTLYPDGLNEQAEPGRIIRNVYRFLSQ